MHGCKGYDPGNDRVRLIVQIGENRCQNQIIEICDDQRYGSVGCKQQRHDQSERDGRQQNRLQLLVADIHVIGDAFESDIEQTRAHEGERDQHAWSGISDADQHGGRGDHDIRLQEGHAEPGPDSDRNKSDHCIQDCIAHGCRTSAHVSVDQRPVVDDQSGSADVHGEHQGNPVLRDKPVGQVRQNRNRDDHQS